MTALREQSKPANRYWAETATNLAVDDPWEGVARAYSSVILNRDLGHRHRLTREMVERFESGAYSSRDVLAILRAGLKGGRADPMPDLEHGAIQGGPMRAAQVAAQLLVRAFALPESP